MKKIGKKLSKNEKSYTLEKKTRLIAAEGETITRKIKLKKLSQNNQ